MFNKLSAIDSLSSVVQETKSPGRFGRFISNRARKDPMKKFVVLYMASGPEFEKMMKNSTPEQKKKGMDAWMKWMNANKTSIVEGGAPLGKTKRVDSNGASNTKNEIGGYSVVQAESHDAATKIFGKDHPHLQMPGAWIEIIEIMPMPGM
jgi:YCII-related domain